MLSLKRARLAVLFSVIFLFCLYSSQAAALSCVDDGDCNDGKTCTLDLCNGNICQWIADHSVCQDSSYCNGFELCDPENPESSSQSGCAEGAPVVCGTGVPDCVMSECSEALSACQNIPLDSRCNDGLACNGSETCDILEGCLPGTPACQDAWFCTTDNCTELGSGAFSCDFAPNHDLCSDNIFCNGQELCNPSDPSHNFLGCVMNVPARDCNDGFDCTVDYCSEAQKKCMNVPDNARCNDNLFCNGQETCNPTAPGHLPDGCLTGEAPDCRDNVGCTDDYCDEDHDVCRNDENDLNCNDFNPCTSPDTCHEVNDCYNHFVDDGTNCQLPGGGAGICREGVCTTGCLKDEDCDDGLACTIDTCNLETETCEFSPNNAYCDNGLWCDGIESCAPGNPESDSAGCLDGSAPNCVDAHDCTVDECDEINDVCKHTPDDSVCDNGVWCDGAETCSAAQGCMSAPSPCNDGISCTIDSCNEIGRTCTNIPQDSLCDDGKWCNGTESCDAFAGCVPGDAPACGDDIDCTDDWCDEVNDVCVNTVNNANCEDYNDCTSEYCDAALDCQYANTDNGDLCQLNPYIQGVCFNGLCLENCTFDDDCPAPACVSAQCVGGLCQFAYDNGYCNDSNVCNGVESCNPNHPDAGGDGCVSTSPLICNDGIECTNDSCHPVQGCVHVPNHSICSDQNYCNGFEICDTTQGCIDGADPSCDDGIPCTIDSCDAVAGCLHVPQNSLCSDGLFCNGVEICDEFEGCKPGVAPDCRDSFDCTVDTCDENNDVCRHTPSNAYCNNGLYCDGVESCNPYNPLAGADGCVPGTPPNCDDGFDCTRDECDEQNDNCYNAPRHDYCDDDAFCNGVEYCEPSDPHADEEGCVSGQAVDCDDQLDCTLDECNEDSDSCEHTPQHEICEDDLWCNGTEYCSEFVGCYHALVPNCNDTITCTLDSCDEENDSCVNQPRDWLCQDSSICNGAEICQVGVGCAAGTPITCNDGWACTLDYCDDLSGGCVFEKRHSECSDGKACNGEEKCDPDAASPDAYGCIQGSPVTCDDGISCTVGTCHEQAPNGYYCLFEPYDSLCNDGNHCNGIETCDPQKGGCQNGTPKNCNDFVDCTDDSCNENTGLCVNQPNDGNCSNNNPCRPLVACDAQGGCLYGQLENDSPCDINPALTEHCQGGFCIPDNMQCQENEDCDDNIGCTVDLCSNGTCVYQPDDSWCQDGLYCNGVEICVIGIGCQDGPDVNCAEQPVDISCTLDTCNEETDSCSHTPINNWCDNGKYCDGVEFCDPLNDCQPGTPIQCPSDDIPCTADICIESSHSCAHVPNDTLCQDGLFCNGAEVCDISEGCRPGIAPIIDDGVPCTIDTCNEGTNLSDNIGTITNTPSHAFCQDGLFCNGAEICDAINNCLPGTPPTIDDGIPCTIDTCDEGANINDNIGTVVNTPSDALCQDGLFCNGAEICDAGEGCLPGNPPNLDDGIPCTIDTCSEGANTNDNIGTVVNTPSDALCQDGLFCNGAEICDAGEGCLPGSPPNPDDGIPCTIDTCSEGSDLNDNLGSLINTPGHGYCQDSDLCNGVESCEPSNPESDERGCVGGEAVICEDDIDCTANECDAESGECNFIPDDSLCDDDIVCTFDICDVEQGCRNPPIDDGESCDIDPEVFEVCFEGVCVKGCQQDEDCIDAFECTREECDTETMLCRIQGDDSLCSNGLFCDGEEICNPELGCTDGTPVDCSDEHVCTSEEYCDENSRQCMAVTDHSQCDDENPCTVDLCAPVQGCHYENEENGTPCGDDGECLDGECIQSGIDGDYEYEYDAEDEESFEDESDGDFDEDHFEDTEDESEPEADGDDEAEADTSDSDKPEPDGDNDRDIDSDGNADSDRDTADAADGDMAADGDTSGGGGGGGCASGSGASWLAALLLVSGLLLRRRRSV